MLLDLILDNKWPDDNPDPDEGASIIIAPIEELEEGFDDVDLEEEDGIDH